jgi:hypothetical protein
VQPSGKPPGDTKKGKDRGGVGGTGISARDAGGIGGTGIVGVITGFGSVCVNGLEVGYDASSRVETDGEPSEAERLAVGQVVVIDAERRGDELWAEQIAVRNTAVGPIAASDVHRGEIIADSVTIDDATRLTDAAARRSSRRPHAGPLVAGRTRRAVGGIVATRVESRAAERVA